MLLAIDVGNTNIVIGCMDGETIEFTERLSTDAGKTSLEYAILFKTALDIHHVDTSRIDGAIISSVVPPVTPVIRTALRKITGIKALILGPGTRTGLNIRLDDPTAVGADLVAGAVGALQKYKPPVIVVDMGTATTLMAIDKDRNFLGGAIMPGVRLSLNSLVSEASMLQGISLDSPKHILYGHAAMIDGLVDRMEEELEGEVTVIATGGLAAGVVPACRHQIQVDDTLLLTGMRIIYEKSRKK